MIKNSIRGAIYLILVITTGYAYTISGYIRDSRGTGIASVTVYFSNSGGSVVTSKSGYYSKSMPIGWYGSAAPNQAGYYFSPASRTYSRVIGDQVNQNYTRYVQRYTISGYVRTSGGTGIEGVTMTFSNGGGTATTSSTGYYSRSVSYNYTGSATPSKTGYSFSPSSTSYSNVQSNRTNQNYTGSLLQYYIYGYVRNAAGEGIAGVTMTFSNGEGTATTNSSGYYYTYVDYGWSGTLTPSIASHTFSPTSLSYTNVTGNYANQNFTGTIKTYYIYGYVRDSTGTGISSAAVAFSNGGGTVYTSSSGYYIRYVDYGWAGTVTPVKSGYSFSPVSRSYSSVTQNYAAHNYTGTRLTYTISGKVSPSGISKGGLSGVTVTAGNGGGTDVTDFLGNYSLTVDWGWSGTVTPSKTGYDFSPVSRSYSSVTASYSAQNFTGTLKTYTISGYTRTSRLGVVSGVTVAFSGLSSVTSNTHGYYSKSVTHGWSGTAAPSKTGYTFSPSQRTYSGVTSSMNKEDYTGSLIQCLVSGWVTDSTTGAGIESVLVTLSNGGGTDLTDANGYWSENVSYGWSGSVTPAVVSHTFTPEYRSLLNVTGSRTSQNFSGSRNKYKVRCTFDTFPPLVPFGLTGVTVHFRGLESRTAGCQMGFCFKSVSVDVPHGWSGDVVFEKTGYGFNPDSIYLDNVTAPDSFDILGYDIKYLISGTIVDSNGNGIKGITFYSPQDQDLWGVTNSDGEYSVAVDYNWTGTIVPSAGYCTTTPVSRSYTGVLADIAGQDYDGEYIWCTVDGKYATSFSRFGSNNGVAGVEIVVDAPGGLPGDTVVYTRLSKLFPENTGTYSVKVLQGANNAFWPSKIGYRFTPGLYYGTKDTTINVLATRLDQITVSGYALAGSDPVGGASFDFYNNYTTYTDASGYFNHDIYLNQPYDSVTHFSGPVSIRHDDYVFLPADTIFDSLYCDTVLGPFQARLKYQYPVISTAGPGGQVSPAGTTYVKEMTDQWYHFIPDSGYVVDDVTKDDTSYGAVSAYLFTNVTDSYHVHASFVPESSAYTVTVKGFIAGSDSLIPNDTTVVPHGDIKVNPGGRLVLTLRPHYHTFYPRVYINGIRDTVNLENKGEFVIGGPFELTLEDIREDKLVWVMWMPPTPMSYYITSFATAGGTITPMGQRIATSAGTYHYDIAPDAGFYILDVRVNNVSIGDTTEYTFVHPPGAGSIVASFWKYEYNVTNTATGNGTVFPSGTFSVYHGDTVGVTIYPDAGYKTDSVWVDSVPQGVISSCVLEHIAGDRSVDAWFSLEYHTISAAAGTGGAITPDGDSSVTYFDTTDYGITPAAGYKISDVLVNDSSVGAVSSWSFENVEDDQTITATFSLKSYEIIAVAGTGGNIAPAGTTVVTHGDTLILTLTPFTGYEVEDLLLDGVSQGKVAACTLAAIDTSHSLSAVFALEHLSLTASANTGGTITPAGDSTVQYGDTVSYVITPAAGYDIDSVVVDGASMGAVDTFTFEWITEDHTIDAYFVLKTYTITASSGANGTISPSGAVPVTHGDTVIFLAEPHTGYRVDSIAVDGADAGTGPEYPFYGVTGDHSISTAFILKTYNVVAAAGTGGGISPAGTTTVDHGEMLSYTITPDTGYVISDVMVDGLSVGAVSSHTFAQVTSGHTVVATFAVQQFTLTASAGTGGSITPSGDVAVNYGTDRTFVMTPDTGYMVNDVLADGISAGAVDSFTFSSITDDHSITASFTLLEYAVTATAGSGGSVSPSGTTWVDYGDSLQITVTPQTGHYITDVLVDGISQGAVTSVMLHDITGSRTVAASFAAYTYPVMTAAGSGGAVNPAGTTMVSHGDSLAVTITPSTGYDVSGVTVNGMSMGAIGSYTFTNVTAGCTLSASFAVQTFSITASAGTGGSITPSGETAVHYGDSLLLTVNPAAGYDIADVLIDSVSQGAVDSVPLSGITADHTVTALFTLKTYDVVTAAGSGGAVSPAGTTTVDHGDSLAVDIIPSTGYEVADVLVDGISIGKTDSYAFGTVDQAHSLTASFVLRTFTVTAAAGVGGSVSPTGGTVVDYGDSLTVVISPLTGYTIGEVLLDSVSQGTADTVRLEGITADHTVDASFILNVYDIITASGTGGSVSPAGTTRVDHGDSLAVAVVPAAGYDVSGVTVDGVPLGAVSSYTFENVSAGHTLAAAFTRKTFTVTAAAGTGGSISPSGNTAVQYGDTLALSVAPATGYSIADVSVDSVSQGAVSSVTLTGIIADMTVTASFAINTYAITASAGSGGTVSPAGTTQVDHGSDQAYIITPESGYAVQNVTVDGLSQGAVTSHTFYDVDSAHTISAAFSVLTVLHTLVATADSGGGISPAGTTTVNQGNDITYTVTPADIHWKIADVLVDSVSQGAVPSYTFDSITAGHSIHAAFTASGVPRELPVYVSAGTGGSVVPSGTLVVAYGADTAVTMTAQTGYAVSDVVVNDTSRGAVSSWTFSTVTDTQRLTAAFTRLSYAVIAAAGSGGSVSPAGTSMVYHGDTVTVAVTPDSGYTVDKVYADGIPLGAVYSHTFPNVTAGHTLTALFKKADYMIIASSGSGGSIAPAGSVSVAHGDTRTFTMTPAAGHRVDSVAVDGVSAGTVSSYTFSGVTAGHTISAAFTRRSYRVVASAGTGGSVSPAGTTAVLYGDTVSVTVTPDSGYVIDKVYVNGISAGAVSSHTFAGIAADQSLSALFKKAQYGIIATSGSGGSIAPAGTVTVTAGTDAAFTVTPATGYVVGDVAVDGMSAGAVTSYTFSSVSAAHTIHAAFTRRTWPVVASAGSGGSVSPAGTTQVSHGDTLTVTVTPDSGYDIGAVYVNGTNQGSLSSHTFAGVTGARSLTAFFVRKTYTIVAVAGYGGAVAPSGTVQVSHGDTAVFTITTMTGFEVNQLIVDGVPAPAALSYTFAGVTSDHALGVECTEIFYSITASSGTGGSLVPGGDISAAHGASVLITMVPDTGYHVRDVTVDGSSVGTADSYLFSDVSGNHTISAAWELNTYTVVVNAGAGGAAAPPGTTVCVHGDSLEIMIVPEPDHMISDVALDGNSIGPVDYYVLRNIDSSHTVTASFVPYTGVYRPVHTDHGGAVLRIADSPVTSLPLIMKVYLPEPDAVRLSLEKMDGTAAGTRTLFARTLDKGWHSISWHHDIDPGLYLIRVEGQNFRVVKKVLIK